MIALTIIGILAVLARPAFKRVVTQARGSVLINDFRVFAAAYTQYAQANGSYPASFTTVGGFPAVMAGQINKSKWSRAAPIGGTYAFLLDNTIGGKKYRALLRVSGSGKRAITFTAAQLLILDKKYDNGVITTGQFFTNGTALNTYYVIEK